MYSSLKQYGQSSKKDRIDEARKCTDCICALIFLAVFIITCAGLIHGIVVGDPRRLYHGFNYAGKLCGIDPSVSSEPYLYWPIIPDSQPEELDFTTPVCVERCYSDDELASDGEFNNTTVNYPILTTDTSSTNTTVTDNTVITYTPQKPYPSVHFGHAYCLPLDFDLSDQFSTNPHVNSFTAKVSTAVSSVGDTWTLLVCVCVCAAFLCFAYIGLLGCCAVVMVIMMLVLAIVLLIGVGLLFLYHGYSPHKVLPMGEEHIIYAQIIGFTSVGAGVLLTLLCCGFCRTIRTVAGVIDAAGDCVCAIPKMVLAPIINVIVQVLWILFSVYGLLCISSQGKVVPISETSIGLGDNGEYSYPVYGLQREFEFDNYIIIILLICLFGCIWVVEWISALGEFITSFAVVRWYFTKPDSDGDRDVSCPLVQSFVTGIRYHAGTIAFGSFLLALCRFIKMVLEYLKRQARHATAGNAVIGCFISAAQCIVSCCECLIRYLNGFVYVEVAINSEGYCTSAGHAFARLVTCAPTFALLEGATTMFTIVGEIVISVGLGGIVYLIIYNIKIFSSTESDWYVPNPELVSLVACVCAFCVCLPVMSLFERASDAIVYCFLEEKSEGGMTTEYTPDSLRNLLDETTELAKEEDIE
eukprot:GHVR01076929.1.p1 GENE.GHVR01076929.1~~GHVR01076929.1.p1  ORF type:complete len:641 (+),score=130.93 GHVR01076929.1:47-1969(+)